MLSKQPALRFVWHHAVRTMSRPSSDMTSFRAELSKAQNIAVLTGAGISAESGVPTFRGAGGLWRKFEATQLATPTAFAANPSLVWEFYQYRRNLVLQKTPNAGHHTLAKAESVLREADKKLTVITQNIDELHKSAGTQNLVELHGSLFETWCSKCHDVAVNRDDPICPALEGKGSPDPATSEARIPREELPQCAKCKGLLRPNVVWFGEPLDPDVLSEADQVLSACDLCLVVGTSSVVYPAAMFAPDVASRGVTVAEFNIEETKATNDFGYHFSGPSGDMLPLAFQDILK